MAITPTKPNKTFSDIVEHTRGSSATYVDSMGSIVTVPANTPRANHHVYDGSKWVLAGLLVEGESRTNLLVGSADLSTQDITISNIAPHTVHFTGSGSVTLSGASGDVTLSGIGTGEENRVSKTFTPNSTGTATVTVSGTVENAQLELGPNRSSYIETTTEPATRYRDNFTIYGSSIPDISVNNAFTIQLRGIINAENESSKRISLLEWYDSSDQSVSVVYDIDSSGIAIFTFEHTESGTTNTTNTYEMTVSENDLYNLAGVFTDDVVYGVLNTVETEINSSVIALPTVNSSIINIGSNYMGTISNFRLWGNLIDTPELSKLTDIDLPWVLEDGVWNDNFYWIDTREWDEV